MHISWRNIESKNSKLLQILSIIYIYVSIHKFRPTYMSIKSFFLALLNLSESEFNVIRQVILLHIHLYLLPIDLNIRTRESQETYGLGFLYTHTEVKKSPFFM